MSAADYDSDLYRAMVGSLRRRGLLDDEDDARAEDESDRRRDERDDEDWERDL